MKVPQYESVRTPAEAKALLDLIFKDGLPTSDWKLVGLDTEFKHDKATRTYEVYYVQICNGKRSFVIDGKPISKIRGHNYDLLSMFTNWFRSTRARKIVSTLAAETRSLAQYGPLDGIAFDTEIADWMLDENRIFHGLKSCAEDFCDLLMKDYSVVFGFNLPGKKTRYVPSMEEICCGKEVFDYVPWTGEEGRKKAESYAALDPFGTYIVAAHHYKGLKNDDLLDWFNDVEMPLGKTLVRMEDRGIGIDLDVLREVAVKVEHAVRRKLHILRATIDKPWFNPRSNPQLQSLLFEELGWPVIKTGKPGKSGTRNPSADHEALVAYSEKGYELADLLLSYRVEAHNQSSFIAPMMRNVKLIDSVPTLFTRFHQARTVTGRLSSGDTKEGLMNFQNIPAAEEKDPYRIRRLYRPTKKGWSLIVGDYSQIELYIIAQLSKDKIMCRAFRNGEDLHTLTACKVWDLPYPGTDPGKQEEFKEKYGDKRKKAKCFHPDTEVLTRAGWKRIVDLAKGEEIIQASPQSDGSVSMQWVVPTEVFTQHHDSKELVHLKNEGMDLRVTPDHRMLGFRKTGAHYVTDPDHINDARYWANAGIESAGSKEVDERLLRLAVAAQADGSFTPSGVRFGFSKARKIERLRGMLGAYANQWSEHTYANGVTSFYVREELATKIRALLSTDKTLPWWWLSLTPKLREAALDEAAYWDSHKGNKWRMYSYSSSKQCNVDVLQALASITGRKTHKRVGKFVTNLSVRVGPNSRGGNLSVTHKPYTDKVACLSVPSTFVLVRDGGIPVVTGQTINFGLNYGMTGFTLSKRIKVSEEEADRYVEAYFDLYKGVKNWVDETIEEAHEKKCVRTMFGAYRRVGEYIDSKDPAEVGHAERMAMNAPIQGTAAQVIKVAMNALEFRSKYDVKYIDLPKDIDRLNDFGTEQLIQVHDELVLQSPDETIEEATKIVKDTMEASCRDWFTEVTVKSSVHHGKSWAEGKK